MTRTASHEKIYTVARFRPHPGKLEEFKRLACEAIAIVREKEPDTLIYEWWFNADETECVAIDCYSNFDAILAHVRNVGPTMRQILRIADRSTEIYGADPMSRLAAHHSTARSNEYYGPHFAGLNRQHDL
jgi:quinol monooxygenase YgiN